MQDKEKASIQKRKRWEEGDFASLGIEGHHLQHSSYNQETLEVEEVTFLPPKHTFRKRRSLDRLKDKSGTGEKLVQSSNNRLANLDSSVNHFPLNSRQDSSKINHVQSLSSLKTDKAPSKAMLFLHSGINLSIISQSKNESLLETPHQRKVNQRQTMKDALSSNGNTFEKWAAQKKDLSGKLHQSSFSLDEICQISVDPCTDSFHQDLTLNNSFLMRKSLSFEDVCSKRSLPLSHPQGLKMDERRSHSLFRKGNSNSRAISKNSVAKKIIEIQTFLLASKGVGSLTSLPKIVNLRSKPLILSNKNPLEGEGNHQEQSIIRFNQTFEIDSSED